MKSRRARTTTFLVGHHYPRGDARCAPGCHFGTPENGQHFDAAGGVWVGMATCSECGSTVQRATFVEAA